ncbi:hypothetical protein AB0I98_46185 [Streptomyces sp. NPDC050211]|uniref:hypothetical protein n=1 Tax=Streptomyces sp. NPDC050211 TaxID=3154932 RepID=UPI003439DB9D
MLSLGGIVTLTLFPGLAQIRPRTRAALTAAAATALPFGIEAAKYAVPCRSGEPQRSPRERTAR